ncbi:MAG TPA: hypothetical protein VKT49_06350 [Bryobacteraceae bacterium]|nr:hypothetical protein [Bryobacteraceae bacterium]
MSTRVDWKAAARVRGLEIPDADVDGIAPRLDALEEAFRTPALQLKPDQEPAATFHADVENE